MRILSVTIGWIGCLGLLAAPLHADWSSPITISDVNANSPDLVIDPSGNATAIWKRFDGSNWIIQAATTSSHNSWSTPVNLSLPGADAFTPQLSVDPSGNIVAIWSRFNGQHDVIQAALGLNGTPTNLSVGDDEAIYPQVASDPFGNVVAIWMKKEGSNFVIQVAEERSGSWTGAIDISSSANNSSGPQVAFDLRGNAIAIWVSQIGGHYIIQTANRPFGGGWSAPQNLSLATADALVPQIVIDPFGVATAIWQLNNGTYFSIQSATRSASGIWSSPVDISPVGQDSFSPQVGVNAQGNAVAVWENHASSTRVVQTADRTAGVWSSPPTNLSSGNQNAIGPQVAVDSAGNAVVVWTKAIVAGSLIEAALRPFNGNWSSPMDVSTLNQDASVADLAANARGETVVGWTNNTLSEIQVSADGFYVSPPANSIGLVKKCTFLNRKDRILVIHWTPSASANAQFYQILRNGQIIATVPADATPIFQIQINPKAALGSFAIQAVSSYGFLSELVQIGIVYD